MISTTVLRIRVARGWNWIQKHGADYRVDLDLVDIATLNMASSEHCILGQAYRGPIPKGSNGHDEVLKAYGKVEPDLAAWVLEHGFDLTQASDDNTGDTWDRLRGAWVEILEGTAP